MILELHVLQNIAPANLNRNDTGSPKDAIFGGYRRARVSSQAWKRAIRTSFDKDHLLPHEALAIRTKRVVDEISNHLVAQGHPAETSTRIAVAMLEGLGLKTDDKSGEELTQYLLYLGTGELSRLADLANQHWDVLASAVEKSQGATGRSKKEAKADVPDEVKKATEAILDGGKAADLALFGRMLADLPSKNIDGAAQVAHAISTHAIENEFDFYTAVDDLNTKEETGAGMMGTVEYNSATFYRYTNVDLDQLSQNLGGDTELVEATIRAYAEAFLTALPTGKQNSFAAQNPASFAVAIVRDKGRWSLANAFVDPVETRKGDLVKHSIRKLADYWLRITEMYGDESIQATPVFVDPCYREAAEAFGAPSRGLTGWLDEIAEGLSMPALVSTSANGSEQ